MHHDVSCDTNLVSSILVFAIRSILYSTMHYDVCCDSNLIPSAFPLLVRIKILSDNCLVSNNSWVDMKQNKCKNTLLDGHWD